ncbi:MAG TPA: SRPBCC family protein [bacterium]|nr:SRPBCC family protein [bacterium]
MSGQTKSSIKKELVVKASQKTAFEIFTQKMDLWWPRSHHIGGDKKMTAMILEPKPGGRWYSAHEDQSQCDCGHVLHWEPNSRLVLNWQINDEFKFDPQLRTEVEILFIPQGPETTLVKFEHRDLERMGETGRHVAGMDQGWGLILELYRQQAQGTWSAKDAEIYGRLSV